jgi:C-terminal processing protease CtpA/Prc
MRLRGLLLPVLSCLTFSVVGSNAVAQDTKDEVSPAAKAYLEHVLDLMQKNALHKKSIDWPKVSKETFAHAKGAQTTFDTYPAIAFAFTQLREHHTWLQLPDTLSGEKRQAIAAEMMKIRLGDAQKDTTASPFAPRKQMEGHMIVQDGKRFAYVVVPMCIPLYSEWEKNGPYFEEFAEKLHGIAMDLQSQKPQGWIIDLRGNQGGNMWPMLAGIGLVIGEGDLGAFVSSDDEHEVWFYKTGSAGIKEAGKEEIANEIKQPLFALPDQPWVAVLFDRSTGSSGEAVAIAFAGRPRERSFGERTAGFSTSNQMYPLSDGASLFLCNGIEADRTGKLYPDGLEPDVKVPGPTGRPAPGEQDDAALLAAEQWLAARTRRRSQ